MSIWLIMIVLHAAFAVISFITGLALLSLTRLNQHTWLLQAFLASLMGMIIFMVAATVSHWYDISIAERVIFSGLSLLGIYMLYRGVQAKNNLKQNKPIKYIDDVGFILISLFNGFIIVALIDLHVPPLLVPLVAVVGTIFGTKYIKSIKQKAASL